MEKYGSIPVQGGSLYCKCSGSGKPVVFIHGFSLDNRMWDDQIPFISRTFHTIRYDVRGFGKSTIPEGNYDHGNDLSELMASLHLPKAVFVGLSMGGAIALNFVITNPEKVEALVLADTSIGYMQPSREAVSFGKSLITQEERNFIHEVKRLWMGDDLFKSAFRREEVKRRIIAMVDDYSGYHWVHENPVSRITEDYMKSIKRIRIPTLIIMGEKDVPKHQIIAGLLMKSIPGVKKTIIHDAGHMCNMEEPEQFNNELVRFLSP